MTDEQQRRASLEAVMGSLDSLFAGLEGIKPSAERDESARQRDYTMRVVAELMQFLVRFPERHPATQRPVAALWELTKALQDLDDHRNISPMLQPPAIDGPNHGTRGTTDARIQRGLVSLAVDYLRGAGLSRDAAFARLAEMMGTAGVGKPAIKSSYDKAAHDATTKGAALDFKSARDIRDDDDLRALLPELRETFKQRARSQRSGAGKS